MFNQKELYEPWILIQVSSKSVEKWASYGNLKNSIWPTFSHHFEYLIHFPHCHWPEAFCQILTCLIWALWVHVTYLFTKCVTESCDPLDWLIQYYLSSASSRVTETVSMKMPCGECFQKCFSAYDMISLWLNTVLPIIVMIWLPKMTRYLHWRIIYRHLTLATF